MSRNTPPFAARASAAASKWAPNGRRMAAKWVPTGRRMGANWAPSGLPIRTEWVLNRCPIRPDTHSYAKLKTVKYSWNGLSSARRILDHGPMARTNADQADPTSSENLVEMTEVNKYFGDLHVLNDINLTVKKGEVVVVLGPSGSGKSTLIRAINRLEPIDSGTILIDGVPLPEEGKELANLRADVGMVFQSFNLFSHKTILENVTLGPIKVRKQSKEEANKHAMELLEKVGIADQAQKLPAQLSGGQQQRAAIARTLAMDPKVILLDEPTSALDPEMINEVLDTMISLANAGMTMVAVTHEMGFAKKAADRIMFMSDGQIVEDATPTEFFQNPKSDRAKDFLSKILHH